MRRRTLSRRNNVRNFALLAFSLAALAGSAFASEEDILPAQKISIAADGRSFGAIAATIETMPDGQGRKIKAIVLHVGGKKFDVPQEQFADLRNPVLNTAEFRTEAGREGGQRQGADSPGVGLRRPVG